MLTIRNQKGSALLVSLVTVAALLILFLAVFSYSTARYGVHVKSQYALRARYLAESGINHTLHQFETSSLTNAFFAHAPVTTQIDSYGSYTIATRPYGAYLLLTSQGKTGSQVCTARAVIGRAPDSLLKNALVLIDERFPLTVTGATQINGDILSGAIDITSGQIDGQGIYQERFHNGNHIIGSPKTLVSSSPDVIADYTKYINTQIASSGYEVSTSLVLRKEDSKYLDEHKIIHVAGNLEINGLDYLSYDSLITIKVDGWAIIRGRTRLEGLIEILADRFILVQDNASLTGGVYYAGDSLVISDDCRFASQGITERPISVRDRARVEYPSALISLVSGKNEGDQATINLSTRKRLSSVCLLIPSDTSSQQLREKIYVDSGVSLEGVMYSPGYVDLRGNVDGAVVTYDFWYYQAPTTYINWLRNAKIRRTALRYWPAMPLPFGKNQNLKPFSVTYR